VVQLALPAMPGKVEEKALWEGVSDQERVV
jgi:hypothetical protein